MDVVSEWCREGVVSFFDKTKKLQLFSFLNQDKPLVISSDSVVSCYKAMETILDNLNSGIYIRDTESKEGLYVNKYIKEIFAAELVNGNLNELFEQGISRGHGSESREMYYKELDQWYDLLYTENIWLDGRAVELFSIHDITDRKIYQRKIEQQAYTDFLTGLYNRMCCERDLAWHIDNAKKNHTTGALLYLDLDDFKHINDGLGHQYGDILLKAISNNLRDIAGIESSCYRVGGDEFIIIIPPEQSNGGIFWLQKYDRLCNMKTEVT